MFLRRTVVCHCALTLAVISVSCSQTADPVSLDSRVVDATGATDAATTQDQALGPQAPPAPAMPTDWRVDSDINFPLDEVQRIAQKLGGAMSALRNTVYNVNGLRVQLNTIVAATEADADKIMASLRKIKPDDFLLRQELVIYEFVGSNDAIPTMLAGKAYIESQS